MTPARLDPSQLELLATARTATLATIDEAGTPRLVPVCFVVVEGRGGWRIVTPIDDKPKASGDPLRLARVGDILRRPTVALLVERWDEDWTRLAWLRVRGTARLVEPAEGERHARTVAALRAKYPQYADHDLEHRPLIEVRVERATSWSAR